ncbi:MAG TPA: lamin tail domain-containing protein, partial [Pirellulales bacterium]
MIERANFRNTVTKLLLGLLLLSTARVLHAEVMLSEVMYNPQNGGANRKWVELYNSGSSAVSLSGWQFGEPTNNLWASALPAGTSLGAGQALVLTPSAATLDSDWGSGINRIQVSNFPALTTDPNNNVAAATLAIRNGSGVIQDQLTYKNGAGWPTANGNDGNSIYVLPQDLNTTANDSGANWKPSAVGVYGAVWKGAGGDSENHASPGIVANTVQAPF